MAHELEIINGNAAMVFVGDRQAIWHRLGTEIPDNLTPAEVMAAAQVDWDVNKVQLFADVSGKQIATGHSALIRSTDDRVLDVVTDTWNPVQNADAFAFFNQFIEAGDMKMDTAGSIRGGRIVWAMAKINAGFTVFGGDEITGYLLFSNPHYFGRCIDIKFTPVRVVCNNTLSYALQNVDEHHIRLSHRRAFDAEYAKSLLGIATAKLDNYKEQAEFLGSRRFTDETVAEYFNNVFPILTTKRESRKPMSKMAARALEVLETQPGNDFAPGTWWQAVNAVTYLTSNEYGKTDETRFDSLMYGANAGRNIKALNLALAAAA